MLTTIVVTREANLVRSGSPETEQTTPAWESIPAGWISVSSHSAQWLTEPIVYGPGSVFLNLGSMNQGRAYALKFGGAELVAVKGKDGSVTFYEIPQQ